MPDPKDISNYNKLSKEQRLALEKKMQQDELSYLSSVAFEQFKVSNAEIDRLNLLVDKKAGKSFTSFNTIFISLLCGLFIGISVFFVIFQKSKTHPSVFQSIEEENNSAKKLNNTVSSTDTVFPEHTPQPVIEHYNTIADHVEETKTVEMPEILPVKTPALPEPEKMEEDIIFRFIPNAPVMFISNLKVTNYRLYYFKRNEAIDLSVNTGLSAQYENNASVEHIALSKSGAYQAHRIIQKAMRLFSSKHIANCIEELNLLYNFNNDDANAQFYLGMCYFQTGKYNFAQNYFQKNLDNENNIFHQESEFYLAMCLLNLKQTDKALEQLQKIVTTKGFYAARAQEVLNKQPR
jgi:tetratricopeptide (TPR) repeat protein